MILRATVPLVAVHGASVTTKQIAQAAGIGEGTIFRVFATKEELLLACVEIAASPDGLLANLATISPDDPLPDRLTEALDLMRAHLERMGAVVGALQASGLTGRLEPPRSSETDDPRAESLRLIREELTGLLTPDAGRLRVAPQTLAGILLGLAFTRPGTDDTAADRAVVDVLLHGALLPPAG